MIKELVSSSSPEHKRRQWDSIGRFYRNGPVHPTPTPIELSRVDTRCCEHTLCSADHIHLFPGQIMTLNGWALAKHPDNPIAEISVMEDGQFLGTALLGIPRPDVLDHFPQFAEPHSGFILGTRRSQEFSRESRINISVRTMLGFEETYDYIARRN
jgi:hypothetical protein